MRVLSLVLNLQMGCMNPTNKQGTNTGLPRCNGRLAISTGCIVFHCYNIRLNLLKQPPTLFRTRVPSWGPKCVISTHINLLKPSPLSPQERKPPPPPRCCLYNICYNCCKLALVLLSSCQRLFGWPSLFHNRWASIHEGNHLPVSQCSSFCFGFQNNRSTIWLLCQCKDLGCFPDWSWGTHSKKETVSKDLWGWFLRPNKLKRPQWSPTE